MPSSSSLTARLADLAQKDAGARRSALMDILTNEGFSPVIQEGEPDVKSPVAPRNYLLMPEGEEAFPLFCAHYDAFPGSAGANDNAAACCILAALAVAARERGIRAGFAFFDGEENGHTGAKLFESNRARELSILINLDMCGYGDTIVVYVKGGGRKRAAAPFLDRKRMEAHGARIVRYIPEGDETCFHSRRQPVLSMAVMPRWDVKYLDAIALRGDWLLGRPPEVRMMLDDMEVSATMHGRSKDRVEEVQPQAMEQVYDYLLDALTAGNF